MSIILSTCIFVTACSTVALFFYALNRAHDDAAGIARSHLPKVLCKKESMIW